MQLRGTRTIEPRENQLMKLPPLHFDDWMPILPKPGSTTSLISIDSRATSSPSTRPHQRDSLSYMPRCEQTLSPVRFAVIPPEASPAAVSLIVTWPVGWE